MTMETVLLIIILQCSYFLSRAIFLHSSVIIWFLDFAYRYLNHLLWRKALIGIAGKLVVFIMGENLEIVWMKFDFWKTAYSEWEWTACFQIDRE